MFKHHTVFVALEEIPFLPNLVCLILVGTFFNIKQACCHFVNIKQVAPNPNAPLHITFIKTSDLYRHVWI